MKRIEYKYICNNCGTEYSAAIIISADEFGMTETSHEWPQKLKTIQNRMIYNWTCKDGCKIGDDQKN